MKRTTKFYDLKFDEVVFLFDSEEEHIVEQIDEKVEELCKKDGFDIDTSEYEWTVEIKLRITQE